MAIKKPPVRKRTKKPIVETAVKTLAENVERMRNSGKWLSVCVRIEDGQVKSDWLTNNYPKEDVDTAIRLIVDDLLKFKAK